MYRRSCRTRRSTLRKTSPCPAYWCGPDRNRWWSTSISRWPKSRSRCTGWTTSTLRRKLRPEKVRTRFSRPCEVVSRGAPGGNGVPDRSERRRIVEFDTVARKFHAQALPQSRKIRRYRRGAHFVVQFDQDIG